MAFGTSNKYVVYEIYLQEIATDVVNNTSTVRVWVDAWRTNTGYQTYGTGTLNCRINGGLYSAGITSSQRITSTPIRVGGAWDVVIPHNADGSATISVTAWISIPGAGLSSSEQGRNYTLTTIPRASTCSVSGDCTLGNTVTINTNRASSGFTHTLTWWCGSLSGTIATGVGSSTTWTIPTDIAEMYPDAVSGAIGIHCTTYNGGTNIGTKDTYITGKIPESYLPTFDSLVATGINLFNKQYLQSKSSVKLTVKNAAGSHGSTVKNYSIKGDTFAYSGESSEFTTTILEHTGDIVFTATITDSRGRTASKTVTITVVPYSPPTIALKAYRANAQGVADDIDGTYIAVVIDFTYAAVSGNSITTKSLKIGNTVKSTTFASGTLYVFSGYTTANAYTVTAYVTDAVGTQSTEITAEVAVGTVGDDLVKDKNGKIVGYAVGRMLDTSRGGFQVGMDMSIDNPIISVKVGNEYKDIDLSKVLIVENDIGNVYDLSGHKYVVLGEIEGA